MDWACYECAYAKGTTCEVPAAKYFDYIIFAPLNTFDFSILPLPMHSSPLLPEPTCLFKLDGSGPAGGGGGIIVEC